MGAFGEAAHSVEFLTPQSSLLISLPSDLARVLRVTLRSPLTHQKHVTRLLDGLAEEAQSLL